MLNDIYLYISTEEARSECVRKVDESKATAEQRAAAIEK